MCNRYLRTIGCATIFVQLGGCASLPQEAVRNLGGEALSKLTQPAVIENYHATVLSPKPPYAVKYAISVQGRQVNPPIHMKLITRGEYKNWSWTVLADPEVAVALEHWRAHLQQLGPDNSSDVSPTLEWNTMIPRLYTLDTYLLGSAPMPIQIKLLLPSKRAYQYNATLQLKQALPALIVVYDNETNTTSSQFSISQLANFYLLQRNFQYLVADAEWKAGTISKPTSSPDRQLKAQAIQICWGYASYASTIAGLSPMPSSFIELLPHAPTDTFAATTLKVLYHLRPTDPALIHGMAALLVSDGLNHYLMSQKLGGPYPSNDSDLLLRFNGIINYCRALTHYQGKIDIQQIPNVAPANEGFFRTNESTATTQVHPKHK